jgi:hypothetical protein
VPLSDSVLGDTGLLSDADIQHGIAGRIVGQLAAQDAQEAVPLVIRSGAGPHRVSGRRQDDGLRVRARVSAL